MTGSSPTGTVMFYKENGATLGSGTLNASGVATFTYAFSNAGNRLLTARYSGNASNTGSTSAELTLVVNPKAPTATTLTASPNPAGATQDVLLTATVTGSAPTGTVTFKDGGSTLGTGTINASGVASLTKSFSSSGTRSLTASYGGDVGNAVSSSTTVSLVVKAKATTTTALVVAPSPALRQQTVVLTATVTGNSPGGEVEFVDNVAGDGTPPKNLGRATVNASGVATLNASFGSTGSHSLTASYLGDNKNETSSSTATPLTVSTATDTALTVSQNPVQAGQGVTLTATVTGSSPTGVVTFMDGTTALGTGTVNSSGIATLTALFDAAGSHALTASYGGDSRNAASSSAAISLTVSLVVSSTRLSLSSNEVRLGEVVTLTASVTGSNPTGTVTFRNGNTVLGSGAIEGGRATLAVTFTDTVGIQSLTATYSGDAGHTASSSAAKSLTVNGVVSSTAFTISTDLTEPGRVVTLTATVTGSNPGGSVTFYDGDTILGENNLNAQDVATFDARFITAGVHSLTATYNGNSNNTVSRSAAVSLTVKTVSSTALTVSPNPAVAGQVVTLTATVTGNVPTGVVSFMEDMGSGPPAEVGRATVNASGIATLVTAFTIADIHILTARYRGDTANTASDSAEISLTVDQATTSTVLTVSPNPAMVSEAVTLTAVVTGSAPGEYVRFYDGFLALSGRIEVDASGIATLTDTFTTVGIHALTAKYSGDSNNKASSSAEILLTVNKAVTSTALTVSPNPAVAGQVVTLTATVTGSVFPKPSGWMTFQVGAITRRILTRRIFSGSVATFSGSLPDAGQYSITASYEGDERNTASSSEATSLTVDPAICP